MKTMAVKDQNSRQCETDEAGYTATSKEIARTLMLVLESVC